MWSSKGRSAWSPGLKQQPHCSWRNHCHDGGWALVGQGMQRRAGYVLATQGCPTLLMCDVLWLNEAL